MKVKQLVLENFRNYNKKTVELAEGVTAIAGDNASGKTNMLEAMYLLATGESFRAKRVEEMVKFGEEWGRVSGSMADHAEEVMLLEVLVSGGEIMGKKTTKRTFFVNGVSKMRKNFVGNCQVVLFRPEDLELMDGSPSVRRNFLDRALEQMDSTYRQSLITYEQALIRRNRLLFAIREGTANRYALTFWNGLLIKHGQELESKRDELIQSINTLWGRSDLFAGLRIVYDKSLISEARLEQYKEEEVAVGYTLVGPHKDDFSVVSVEAGADVNNARNLAVYGSRGEQRMAVLALKMGELYYMEERNGQKVILLLDDVFSELDENHSQEVHRLMKDRQVLVTTANKDDLTKMKAETVVEL